MGKNDTTSHEIIYYNALKMILISKISKKFRIIERTLLSCLEIIEMRKKTLFVSEENGNNLLNSYETKPAPNEQ